MPIPAQISVPFSVKLVATLAGAPGTVDHNTPIVWSYVPAASAVIVPSVDGLTATVTANESGVLSVTADGNLGQGVLELSASQDITVVDVLLPGADAIAIESAA